MKLMTVIAVCLAPTTTPRGPDHPVPPYVEIRHATSSVMSDGDYWKVRVDVTYSSDVTGYVTVDLWDEFLEDWQRCYTLTEEGQPTIITAWEVTPGLVGKPCVAYFEWRVSKSSPWGEDITAYVPVYIKAKLWRNDDTTLEAAGEEWRD